jgi:ATP-binding cassette subfamily B protein
MPLLEPMPDQVENALKKIENGTAGDRHISFATDIGSNGEFGEEWLVVTSKNLYVFSPNGGTVAETRHALPLDTIRNAHSEMLVGNGVLEIRTDKEVIPVLRFSNAVTGKANATARHLSALAKGEEPKAEEIEEKKSCPNCGRILPEDSEVCLACMNKRAVMVRLFRFLAPYKAIVAGGLVVLVGISLTDLVAPYIGGRIVDVLVNERSKPDLAMQHLIMLVTVLAGTRVIASGLQYAQRRLNSWIGARTLMDIRVALFHRFNKLSLGYYDKRSTGSVMSRITNDADNLWDFLMDGAPWFVSNALNLVLTSIVLFRMNSFLALLLLTPAPCIILLTRWFMPRARERFRLVWHRISKMYSSLNSALNGMRVIKAFAQEDRENARFDERNRKVFEASFSANAMWAVYFPILGLLMGVGAWIIWLVGGYSVLHGVMTLGTLTAFSGYLMQFYAPFQNFSRALDWSTRSLTAAERVFEVLDTEPDIRESANAVAMPEIKGAVEFKDVSFSYDKNKRVLEDFTLNVKPGEMIGLVGHSGAGKSTLINLLTRFYDVSNGAILIDGVDIRNIKQEDFRHQLGIVLQEPFLFPGTIRDNIAYAKPDATPEEVMRAAKVANCHEFILKFPDGYDSSVGERGQRLSGGERQRISIARAILHDPKILILDEATASVDTETEKQIQEAIARLIENRTTFAIAHRLSTLRNADRLVVMKDGKMAEMGTHDELIEADGVYAGLVKVQTEINKIRAA